MHRGLQTALALVLLCCTSQPVVAQTTRPAPLPTTLPGYPDSVEGLTKLMKDMLAASAAGNERLIVALAHTMVLPNHVKWFNKTFGETTAPRLIKEFEETASKVDVELAVKMLLLKEPTKLAITVQKFEAADDLNARIYQRLAMQEMQQPTALYSVTMTLPGTSAKIEIWSIVYVDGAFRIAGKMQKIRG